MTLDFEDQKKAALAEPNFTVASSEAGRLLVSAPTAQLLITESLRRMSAAVPPERG